MMATLTTNPATLSAVLTKQAKAGDVVQLEAGDYKTVMIAKLVFAEPVVVRGGPGVVLDVLWLDGCAGLTFSGLEVGGERNGYGVMVVHSQDIRLEGLNTHTGASGFMLRSSRGVVVTGCEIANRGTGIGHLDCDGLEILDNHIHDVQLDGIRGGGSSNVVVRGNRLHDFHPKAGDHPDAIQFWSTALNPKPKNILIEGNSYDRRKGGIAQGIFIESCAELTIRDNTLRGCMYNGISLSACEGAEIAGNFVQGYPDMGSRIIVRGASRDVRIEGNAAEAFVDYPANGANVNLVIGENRSIAAAAGEDLAELNAWRGRNAPPADPRDAEIETLKAKVADLTADLATTSAERNAQVVENERLSAMLQAVRAALA